MPRGEFVFAEASGVKNAIVVTAPTANPDYEKTVVLMAWQKDPGLVCVDRCVFNIRVRVDTDRGNFGVGFKFQNI